MSTKKVAKLEDVDRIYEVGSQPFYALKEINVTFADGEFTGLVGPSGSGKTTLLNLIGALDFASHGNVEVLGQAISKLQPKAAAKLRANSIGFIFQHYQLFPVYSVFENVEFPLQLLEWNKSDRENAVMEALNWVGLANRKDDRPNKLSGGQCQRVAIARAMVKRPKLVLADEPTANLDADNSHRILQTMQELNRNLGTTFIFSTHDEKVIQYLRRKVCLDDGKIVEDTSR